MTYTFTLSNFAGPLDSFETDAMPSSTELAHALAQKLMTEWTSLDHGDIITVRDAE